MIPLESQQNDATLFNLELLKCKKGLTYLTSIENKDINNDNEDEINELINFLNEMTNCKAEIDDLIKLQTTYEEKHQQKKLFKDKFKHESLPIMSEFENIQKEYDQIQEILQKVTISNEYQNDLRAQNLKHQTHESQMNLINNDQKLIEQVNKAEQVLINIIELYSKKANSSEDIVFKKYSILEILTAVHLIEKKDSDNSDNCYILFENLPDECLDFENYKDNPLLSKTKISKLSNKLLDKYASIFKKRKKKLLKSTKNCVVLNDFNDFQIIYESYLKLLCFIMAKQEIEEAKKQFAIDWIEGSQVLTVLINSKASKTATVVLPKFYPLSGTSLINVISLVGYENSVIENFKIEKNLSSLSEWISQFTDLYNTNQIM